ncbi:MAG: Lipase precursor [Myxococcales bacterium]|nr:Lipase precursor [Myxococcales bacterium]
MRRLLTALVAVTACATPADPECEAPDKDELATSLADGKADTSIDWCARWDWYEDGDCDQFCLKPDRDCQNAPLGAEPQGNEARYPIVLVHGFMGSRTSPLWSFYQLADALRADGHVVIEADLPPFDAPANRARVLATQITGAIAAHGKVNIIAHSQGGLDARYLIATLGHGDRVASLTTISSPHQGTAIADKALGLLPGGIDQTFNRALKTLGIDVTSVNVRAAMTGLAERNAPAFNAANRDDARVYYQSWAGVSSPTGVASSVDLAACDGKLTMHAGTMDKLGLLLPSLVWKVVGHGGALANDGVATVAGAKHGVFRGCIPADHMDQVGQVQDTFDPATGWDHLRFYRNVAFELAARGL